MVVAVASPSDEAVNGRDSSIQQSNYSRAAGGGNSLAFVGRRMGPSRCVAPYQCFAPTLTMKALPSIAGSATISIISRSKMGGCARLGWL